MESARDAYAQLRPASPWRWVPAIVFPVLLVPIDLAIQLDLGWRAWALIWVLELALLALVIVAWFRVGSGTPVDVAEAMARESGERVVSRPGLAPAMIAVGYTLIVLCFVGLGLRLFQRGEDLQILRAVGWMSVFCAGMFLVRHGRERPWDLNVVERMDARVGG